MATLSFPFDPFQALGLSRDASPRAIKARYYQLARKYHPNTYHGQPHSPGRPHTHRQETEDNSKAALSAYFHRIWTAYNLLSKETQRKRYIEWAALEDLDNEVETHRLNLEYIHEGDSSSDGWSSDLEDFDVAEFYRKRRGRSPGDAAAVKRNGRSGSSASSTPELDARGRRPSHTNRLRDQDRGDSTQRAAVERRKKLNRIRRKEVEVFEAYREAKVFELEAQIEAERLKDIYEKTKAKREKIERIPMETSTRVKMISNILKATKLLRPAPRLAPTGRRPSLQISVVNDDFTSISSPLSARPTMSLHRRGFSSDISGDQTDSDEETPHPHVRHPYRSPTPNGHNVSRERSPRPQPVPILRPIQAPTPFSINALGIDFDQPHHDSPPALSPEEDPKFRLFVKRPTGFGEHEVEELTSPTSPVPFVNDCREVVHLPGGIPLQVSASDSADVIAGAAQLVTDSDSDSSPVRQGMFALKVIGDIRFLDHVPKQNVHMITTREETKLLGAPLDLDTNPRDLLKQLAAWDKTLASRFMIKLDVKSSFIFRLVCNTVASPTRKHQSFLALSYRRKKMVEKTSGGFTLPLSPEMFQAVWEERLSDEEGIWIDQISIDQDSNEERDMSMVAMDLVYRGARLIVVVLDDFPFTAEETKVLSTHMEEYERMRHVSQHKRFRKHSPPWLEQREDLLRVITKILQGSWFRRAWCRHEMRLAKDHIFLIPCRSLPDQGTTVLRLSSACLAHLLALAAEVAFSPSIELLKPALHAFFKDRTEEGKDKRSHHGNFTTVAAEVFRMEAGGDPRLPVERQEADARWDRMSIILNAMECGLALKPLPDGSRQELSNADCYYSLLMLALAARDPGALCSAGKPMIELTHKGKPVSSWLFEPTIVDAGLNNYKTLKRLPLHSPLRTGMSKSTGRHWVQLDLKILSGQKDAKRQTAADVEELKCLARLFVERCEKEKWGRQRRRYILHDTKANENFGDMTEVYVQTLTGVFCCGPEWMSTIAHRYGVARWRQDLQFAYWLMVNLVSMKGRWPHFERKEDDWTSKGASFIMDFTNFLIIRGLPQRQLRQPEKWRPIWVTTKNRGKVLTFSPERTDIIPAIPCVLLDVEYRDLARLWMLEAGHSPGQWVLLGKSVLFTDDLAKQVINSEDEQVHHHQTVYGRALV